MIKIKHFNKYTNDKLQNYNGKEVGILYKYDNVEDHNCNSIYSCGNSIILNSIMDSNKNFEENYKSYMFGGAPKKVVKKEKNDCDSSKKIFSIKQIGNIILEEIVDNFPFILKNNNIDDYKLLEIIHRLIKQKSFNLTQGELNMVIKYLRDNVLTSIKSKIINKHPLFETIKNELYMNDINSLINSEYFIDYKKKIMLSKAISYEWEDLSNLAIFENRFRFKENIIHPLFIILYGLKFPGFEELSILQDYSSMIKDLKNDDFDGSNLFLLFLRISDVNYLPSTNKKHMNAVNNENLRVNISMLLKEIAFSIRTGNFENKLSNILINYLLEIDHSNSKFEEEKLIKAILSVFSFKPTLITKSQNNNILFNKLIGVDNDLYSIPEAVYTIEYALNDFYNFNQDEVPIFSNANLKNIVYDPITKKVKFSYYNNNNNLNNADIQENLLNNFYEYINNKNNQNEVSFNEIGSTLLSKSCNIEEFYKETKPVNVLLTNGLFIVSIPRETIRYTNNPRHNLFYFQNRNKSINISPVLIETVININKINYFLAGGLCYDILEDSNICMNTGLNYVKKDLKIGTYSIIKLSNNKWIEYNPNIYLTNSRIRNFIAQALYNNYMHESPKNENGKSIEFNDWRIHNEDKITKQILNNNISLVDMYISEDEALKKLSMFSNLLFYKEPYEQYKIRNEMKCC